MFAISLEEPSPGIEASSQRRVAAMAKALKTEADIEAFTRPHKLRANHYAIIALSVLGVALAMILPGNAAMFGTEPKGGGFLFMAGLVFAVLWLSSWHAATQFTGALSKKPALEQNLYALAKRSPAVAAYVAQVKAAGRTLRVYDVGGANTAYAQELKAKQAEAKEVAEYVVGLS
jgi:hypothetical protein